LAVDALHRAWHTLVASAPKDFAPSCKEPHLTEKLCLYLMHNRAADRLTGRWSYENNQGELVVQNGTAKVVKRKRTDIKYYTNHEDPELDLIFEFKKLNHLKAQRDKYSGDEGMARFVTGEYSLGQPVALMVGILTVHQDDAVAPLMRWLNSADAKTLLHMEAVEGRHTRSPSRFFKAAHFDTEHMRPIGKGPVHGTIVISHLLLGFPDLPRSAARKERRASLQAALDG
jgi:hypothetical protein